VTAHRQDAREGAASAPGTARSLQGQRALVTGGSSGIGRAIAEAFARQGAHVLVTYRGNADGAHETVRAIEEAGGTAEAFTADIGTTAGVDALAASIERRGIPLDVWCNNAGADILTGAGGALSPREKLARVLDVDLRGTVLASWAAVEHFKTHGRGGLILNMSWDHVPVGMAGENPGIYAAAKGGVEAFSKGLAREVAPEIRVNILAPGFIDTAFGHDAATAWRERVIALTPMARWGLPADVASAAVYLARPESRFLTGQVIRINGGVVM
jgi:3-oxoacyl-[acyl-carrier protein] reductase